jgi:hypothetical protein
LVSLPDNVPTLAPLATSVLNAARAFSDFRNLDLDQGNITHPFVVIVGDGAR